MSFLPKEVLDIIPQLEKLRHDTLKQSIQVEEQCEEDTNPGEWLDNFEINYDK